MLKLFARKPNTSQAPVLEAMVQKLSAVSSGQKSENLLQNHQPQTTNSRKN